MTYASIHSFNKLNSGNNFTGLVSNSNERQDASWDKAQRIEVRPNTNVDNTVFFDKEKGPIQTGFPIAQ